MTDEFYRRHVLLRSEKILHWLMDKDLESPEDEMIAALDRGSLEAPEAGPEAGPEEESAPSTGNGLAPLAPRSLESFHADLVWIFLCRENGHTWREISDMLGLRTPAASWKRYQKLLDAERGRSREKGLE
jgi:hypothetical protein